MNLQYQPEGQQLYIINVRAKKVYSFIKSQVTYRTSYNQSTGYTKYGPPAQHAG